MLQQFKPASSVSGLLDSSVSVFAKALCFYLISSILRRCISFTSRFGGDMVEELLLMSVSAAGR